MVNYNRLTWDQACAAEKLVNLFAKLLPGSISGYHKTVQPLDVKLQVFAFKFISKSRKNPTQAGWGPSSP